MSPMTTPVPDSSWASRRPTPRTTGGDDYAICDFRPDGTTRHPTAFMEFPFAEGASDQEGFAQDFHLVKAMSVKIRQRIHVSRSKPDRNLLACCSVATQPGE